MAWILTEQVIDWEPLNGGPPWSDLTDEEMDAADAAYEAVGYPPESLRESGFWEYEADPPADPPPPEGGT